MVEFLEPNSTAQNEAHRLFGGKEYSKSELNSGQAQQCGLEDLGNESKQGSEMAFDPSAPYSSAMDDVPLKLLFGVKNLKKRRRASREKKTIPMDSPSPKSLGKSSDSIRTKLRESRASALDMVCDREHKEDVQSERQLEASVTERYLNAESQFAETTEAELKVTKDENCDGEGSSKMSRQETLLYSEDGLVSSPLKRDLTRDLLQEPNDTQVGCGLNASNVDIIEEYSNKRMKLEKGEISVGIHEQMSQNSQVQTVACKTEDKLFKIHSGVDKKYREKSSSASGQKGLSKPKQRPHMLSGEVTPENLCSMTAEQLASKELSQQKIARAEEHAHTVIPRESDPDVRRPVKKNRKSEFQVKVEKDNAASVVAAQGGHLISASRVKQEHAEIIEITNLSRVENSIGTLDNHETAAGPDYMSSSTLSDQAIRGTDTKEGAAVVHMATTEDAKCLPVIVSLNEYMDSKENKSIDGVEADAFHEKGFIQEEETKLDNGRSKWSGFSFTSQPSAVDTNSVAGKKINAGFELTENLNGNLADLNGMDQLQAGKVVKPSPDEKLWEGCLQLNAYITVTALAFFKSGEKAPTNNWSKFVEVKGRVRLDAFEKFLQELPLSRNRALMVVSICWKVGSSETGRIGLKEVANSYKQGERVGFAELAPGVDLYVCPPDGTMINMLTKYGSYKNIENPKNEQDNLIGCVVWRRNYSTSNVTPKMPEQYINAKKLALLGQLLDSPSRPGVSQWTLCGSEIPKIGVSTCLETNSTNVENQGSDMDEQRLQMIQSANRTDSFVANTRDEDEQIPIKDATSNMVNVHGPISHALDSADLPPGFSPWLTSSVHDPQISTLKVHKQSSLPTEIRSNDLTQGLPPGFGPKASAILNGRDVQHQPTDQDDDDLPEFDFRGVSVTSQAPACQLSSEGNNVQSLSPPQFSVHPSTAQPAITVSNPGYFQSSPVSLISPQSQAGRHQNTQQVSRPPTTPHPSLQVSNLIQKFGQSEAMAPFSSGVNCRPNTPGPDIAPHLCLQPGVHSPTQVSPNGQRLCLPNKLRKSLWDDDDDIPEWCPPYLQQQDCPRPSVAPPLPPQSGISIQPALLSSSGIPIQPSPTLQSGIPKFVGSLKPAYPPPPRGPPPPRLTPSIRGPAPQMPPLPQGPQPPLPPGPRPLNDMLQPIPRPMSQRGHGQIQSSHPPSFFPPRSNFPPRLSRPEFRPVRPVDGRARRF